MTCPLRVADIHKTTDDCVIVTLDVPHELKGEFQFVQGQYLTLDQEINGERVRRSYSLCSSPLDAAWRVGIKRVEGGRFSTYANERLQIGDVLNVDPPQGNFFIDIDTTRPRHYMAFAAGSGITPIMSIIRTHLVSEEESTFTLFYVNQRTTTIILKEELEALKNQYLGRFRIYYLLTKQDRAIPILSGRIDDRKLDIIFDQLSDIGGIDHFFLCGPEAMIMTVRDYLFDHNVSDEQVHFELFGVDSSRQATRRKALEEEHQGEICTLTITEGGSSSVLQVNRGASNVLDLALENATDLPFACKGGVCCTCKAKLVSGQVEMLVSYGLEQEEIDEGYILTCQAVPISKEVEVNFDV